LHDGHSLAPLVGALRPVLKRMLRDRFTEELEEELLSDFVVSSAQPSGRRQLERMLSLPDETRLRGAVSRRLRQLWTERLPHWNLLRTLRGHVRAALSGSPPAQAQVMPARLQDEFGEWQAEAVAAAARVLVQQQPGLASAPNDVAALLFRQFGPGSESPLEGEGVSEVPTDAPTPDEYYQRFVEAPRHAEALRLEMGPELFDVLALRLRGAGFQEISEKFGHPRANWAHRRFEHAEEIFRRYLFAHGITYRSGLAVGRKVARAYGTGRT
jgi:hypothetical protein